MAFAITGQSTREGVHEFTLSGQKVKYDSNLDLLFTWIGGLLPHWGTGTIPEPFIRQQIINATNGQVGYGESFMHMPPPMPKPADLTDRTKVELAPVPTITLGRIPHMRSGYKVSGIGLVPTKSRVDFTKTLPIPKRVFLGDMPTDSEELKGFITDFMSVFGKPYPIHQATRRMFRR